MIRYLIIDDEHIAHKIIMEYCELLPNMELQKNCYSALEALQYLNEYEVDLIFLDLNMPKLKGFEFLKTLSVAPKVIVTTAYQEYALEGYELNVIDYLLKPFGFERFLKAVNKTISSTTSVMPQAIDGKKEPVKSVFLRENKKITQVNLETIQYIEAASNYTKVKTTNGTHTVREKFSDTLSMLSENGFMQVHKSFAVALAHIKSVEGNRILIDENVIPIGKLYKMNVNEFLKQ